MIKCLLVSGHVCSIRSVVWEMEHSAPTANNHIHFPVYVYHIWMAGVCVCAGVCGNKCDQHLDSTKIGSKYLPFEAYHHKILIVSDTSFRVEWTAEHAIKSDQNQYKRLCISAQISWQLDEFGASSSALGVSRSLSQIWAPKIRQISSFRPLCSNFNETYFCFPVSSWMRSPAIIRSMCWGCLHTYVRRLRCFI